MHFVPALEICHTATELGVGLIGFAQVYHSHECFSTDWALVLLHTESDANEAFVADHVATLSDGVDVDGVDADLAGVGVG